MLYFSFDDPIGTIIEPELISINYTGEEIGRVAAENLMEEIV